jgi:methionyl-tRNA formyltransferase
MNIVFMGTPAFAVPALRALAADKDGRFSVKLVLTRPDAASGRGKALLPSSVRRCAEELGIPVLTPRTLANAELLARIAAAAPDIIVVAAYGMILPRQVLDVPRYGCINIHASLLPRWRGAAPIQRAILAGDEQAGICIMRMEERLDAGDVCDVAATSAVGKPAQQLTDELAELGARLLVDALPRVVAGTAKWHAQDETQVTFADKVEKHELALSPADTALTNVRRVLASTSQAPARCLICDRPATILSGCLASEQKAAVCVGDLEECQLDSFSSSGDEPNAPCPSFCGEPSGELAESPRDGRNSGRVSFTDKRLFLTATDGSFEVVSLKPDGKKEMPATAFAAGVQELQKGSQALAAWRAL